MRFLTLAPSGVDRWFALLRRVVEGFARENLKTEFNEMRFLLLSVVEMTGLDI